MQRLKTLGERQIDELDVRPRRVQTEEVEVVDRPEQFVLSMPIRERMLGPRHQAVFQAEDHPAEILRLRSLRNRVCPVEQTDYHRLLPHDLAAAEDVDVDDCLDVAQVDAASRFAKQKKLRT